MGLCSCEFEEYGHGLVLDSMLSYMNGEKEWSYGGDDSGFRGQVIGTSRCHIPRPDEILKRPILIFDYKDIGRLHGKGYYQKFVWKPNMAHQIRTLSHKYFILILIYRSGDVCVRNILFNIDVNGYQRELARQSIAVVIDYNTSIDKSIKKLWSRPIIVGRPNFWNKARQMAIKHNLPFISLDKRGPLYTRPGGGRVNDYFDVRKYVGPQPEYISALDKAPVWPRPNDTTRWQWAAEPYNKVAKKYGLPNPIMVQAIIITGPFHYIPKWCDHHLPSLMRSSHYYSIWCRETFDKEAGAILDRLSKVKWSVKPKNGRKIFHAHTRELAETIIVEAGRRQITFLTIAFDFPEMVNKHFTPRPVQIMNAMLQITTVSERIKNCLKPCIPNVPIKDEYETYSAMIKRTNIRPGRVIKSGKPSPYRSLIRYNRIYSIMVYFRLIA